jgi:hypothetical protein
MSGCIRTRNAELPIRRLERCFVQQSKTETVQLAPLGVRIPELLFAGALSPQGEVLVAP